MTLYTIEFEVQDEAAVPRFGHVTVAAPDAAAAMEEFARDHPGADVTELRRVHV